MYHHPTLRGGEIASFRSFRWSSWHVTYSFPRLLKMSALFSSLFRRDRECSAWITFGQAGACSHRSKSLSRLIQSEHGLGRSRQIFISQRFCTKRGRGKKKHFPWWKEFFEFHAWSNPLSICRMSYSRCYLVHYFPVGSLDLIFCVSTPIIWPMNWPRNFLWITAVKGRRIPRWSSDPGATWYKV